MLACFPLCLGIYITNMKSYTNVQKYQQITCLYIQAIGTLISDFWIVVPLFIQWIAIQLQLLVCDTKANAGILFGKDAFNQLVLFWKD